MVGDDGRDLDRQLAGARAEQQIVQAMADLRDQDHHARLDRGIEHAPLHREALADGREALAQRLQVQRLALRHEMHPHEEAARELVAELVGVEDVAALLNSRPDTAWTMPGWSGQDSVRMKPE